MHRSGKEERCLAIVPEDRLHHSPGVRLAIPASAADRHGADAELVPESIQVAERSLGNLWAFGDLLGDIRGDQACDASLIAQIGGFKRGSSSILPYELEAANQADNGAKLFGDVLGGAGSLALNASLSGAGGDTIANPLELKFGADPWRGLRSTGDKSLAGQMRLGSIYPGTGKR